MRGFALLGLALSGCFYTEQINQRPSIDIRQQSGDLVYRGSTVALQAQADDPENHFIELTWRVYACSTVEEPGGCDEEPFHETGLSTTNFIVPSMRTDQPAPPQVLRVILEAKDEYGAIARPRDELLIPISNHAPLLDLEMRPRNGYTNKTPIDLFAKVGDEDDAAELTQLTWTVYSPAPSAAHVLTDILDVPQDPDEPDFLQLGKKFTPEGVGEWEVEVTALDPLGATTTKSLVINVVPDRAPCLAQWAPIAAPMGSAWPLTEPTLFQISIVNDDLDPYPTIPGDSELGPTKFSWSILQPGASQRTLLGTKGNQAALDPDNYAPGDIVELRVEIQDRNNTAITCADNAPTCSVISDNQCIQRLTWRVEVR